MCVCRKTSLPHPPSEVFVTMGIRGSYGTGSIKPRMENGGGGGMHEILVC